MSHLFGDPQPVLDDHAGEEFVPAKYLEIRTTDDLVSSVYIRKKALDTMRARGLYWGLRLDRRYDRRLEVGFICLGSRRPDAQGITLFVEEIVFTGVGTECHVEITTEQKNSVHQQYPRHDIVGWAHTHPNFGVSFSPEDLRSCLDFGRISANIVYDPVRDTIAIYRYTTSIRSGDFHDVVYGPLGGSARSRTHTRRTQPQLIKSTQLPTPSVRRAPAQPEPRRNPQPTRSPARTADCAPMQEKRRQIPLSQDHQPRQVYRAPAGQREAIEGPLFIIIGFFILAFVFVLAVIVPLQLLLLSLVLVSGTIIAAVVWLHYFNGR